MLLNIFLVTLILFILAYFIYGKFLDRKFEVNKGTPTPSHTEYDGVDRVPTKPAILLGHHFSSIAGAGPIVGPIIAAIAFGWLPALLWIVIGSIFVGGVHDYSSLMASIRHKARSVGEIAKLYMTPLSYKLFLVFVWLALVYILVVFVDLTSAGFTSNPEVATSSILYIFLAILFGLSVYRLGFSIKLSSLIFVPLVFAGIFIGQIFPIDNSILPAVMGDVGKTWNLILIAYCFIASITPVWILLQPRDYLSSFLLYGSVLGALGGILFGGFEIKYPFFTEWSSNELGAMFPILFITVACGACSGFHCMVASGTTSKQLDKESHARPIGYGSMLLEGVVAVISLFTVAMIATGSDLLKSNPLDIYGNGLGNFLAVMGLPYAVGKSFGILAVSTFLLTTLDTATRLSRYIVEEFFGMRDKSSRYLATLASVALPILFNFLNLHDAAGNPVPAWKAIWPVFGATNQLMAGLALLVVYVWLRKKGKNTLFVGLPMLFMLIMTLWALAELVVQYGFSIVGVIGMILFILAVILVIEAIRTLLRKTVQAAIPPV
jgi:carbon starvation protein